MKKTTLILIGSMLSVIVGCNFGGVSGLSDPDPPLHAEIEIMRFEPTAIEYDVITPVTFTVRWEVDSSLVGGIVINVILSDTEAGGWKDPIVAHKIRTASGQTEFTMNVLFKSCSNETEWASRISPFAIISIYQEYYVTYWASDRIDFDVIP